MVTVLKNSVFYHIPKTGGSWINEGVNTAFEEKDFVRPPELAHAGPDQYSAGNKISFTVIRHPISWHKSNFSYRTLQNDWGIFGKFASDNPNEYIRRLYEEWPHYLTNLYKEFVYVRYVALNETMEEDLRTIFKRAGETLDEDAFFYRDRVNTSKSAMVNFKDEVESLILDQESWIIRNYYEI